MSLERPPEEGAPGLRSPRDPAPLPPELAEFLSGHEFACLLHPTDKGSVVLVAKLPGREIASVVGPVPIEFRHQLHDHPAAPVIRMITRIYDQPGRPLALESFINVGDPQQRSDYEALASVDPLYMLFYDERLVHRLTKSVGGMDGERITDILTRAAALLRAIPEDRFDFNAAKAAVMARTSL